jgi:signal transduction histidine kinase
VFATSARQLVPRLADLLLTVLPMAFVLGITTVATHWQPGAQRLDLAGYLWLAGTSVPLLWARALPLPVFVLTGALTVAYYASDYPGGPAIVLPTIALFLLARKHGPLIAAITGTVLVLAGLGAYLAFGGSLRLDARAGLIAVWLAAVIGIGTAVRNRIAAVRAAREGAAEHEGRMAEQERLRVAREVHDVVAHSLAMINVQAGVAAHVADRRPEQAKEALVHIKQASAAALDDLRATLAVLRSGESRAPAPSLRQMSELFDHAKAAGIAVRVHGAPGDLPAPTDGAAYRILQESLTNVVRHANSPRHVDVHFGRIDGALELVVRDDGMGATEPKIGNGMRGMRERAEALGGKIIARPVGGGFEVRAELPVQRELR